ncbi:MAG: nucleotide-binding domain containing protein [Rubrivivax sp.]
MRCCKAVLARRPRKAAALAWAREVLGRGEAPLLYSTAAGGARRSAGGARSPRRPARASSRRWQRWRARSPTDGVQRWVVAGGRTSGAVVQALGVRALRIGPAICPGVPWTQAAGSDETAPRGRCGWR